MYQPAHFLETRPERLHALMRAHPLALIVRSTPQGLQADPLPLHLVGPDDDGPPRLLGHVARANPMWRETAPTQALAVFSGPQGYVSPSWYPSKQDHGKVVPTWNYATVQAHGTLRFIDDTAWVRAQIEQLTLAHESARARPWAVGDAPSDFIARLVDTVVGVEMVVTRLEGKFKLSQNRAAADLDGVIHGLETEATPTAHALAQAMRGHTSG